MSVCRLLWPTIILAALLAVSAAAQSPKPCAGTCGSASPTGSEPIAFDVASIKPSAPGTPPNFRARPGGTFVAANMSLLRLITIAHQVRHDPQVVGVPDWVRKARYDIQAKAPAGIELGPLATIGPPSPVMQMLAALLRDRFGLSVHHERREMAAYALISGRADRRLGPNLKVSSPEIDCAALVAARKVVRPSTPPPQGQVSPCLILFYNDRMVVGTQPLEQLANFLSTQMNRVVIDRTGLTGNFDFDLTWAPDQFALPAISGGDQSNLGSAADAIPTGPFLATAVREQLGLRLESVTAPTDVLVIDSISPPTVD
jgi:uncharacterized protein (TIGR03435 family)